MILRLIRLIPHADGHTQNAAGAWVRAVSMPPMKASFRGRIREAWRVVFDENVFAVHWPYDGEFEQAMARNGDSDGWGRARDSRPVKPRPRLPENAQ